MPNTHELLRAAYHVSGAQVAYLVWLADVLQLASYYELGRPSPDATGPDDGAPEIVEDPDQTWLPLAIQLRRERDELHAG